MRYRNSKRTLVK